MTPEEQSYIDTFLKGCSEEQLEAAQRFQEYLHGIAPKLMDEFKKYDDNMRAVFILGEEEGYTAEQVADILRDKGVPLDEYD